MSGEFRPARPAPIDAGEAYDRRSGVQAAGLIRAVELLERSAASVELPQSPRWILIADYGGSAGHGSLLPIGAAIKVIRPRVEPGRAIVVVHTDVAENDYSALFEMLVTDFHSYLHDDPAIFPSAVGRSLYQQVLPTGSVTLGWSSWAVHWLSKIPTPIPDHVQITYSRDEAARSAWARQAADDWITFLTARSRELAPGGRLVLLTIAVDEGDFGYRALLDGIVAELADMVSEDVVTADEVAQMAIPTVGRTEADLMSPFAPKNRFAGITLDHLEIFDGEDRIWNRYQKDGDAAAFGSAWTAFAQNALVPSLTKALSDGARAQRFVERLTAGLAPRLAADPQKFRIPLAKMLLTKHSWPR